MSAWCGNLGAVDIGSITYDLAGRGLLIGTCSWTDPTLTGNTSFYPRKEMTAEERLRHYAGHFPIAEVDSTYYAPPSEMTAGLWVDRTPDGFTFDIKAFRLMTQHPTPLSSLWKDFREKVPDEAKEKKNIYVRDLPRELQAEAFSRFAEALMPLHSSGKLGLILFQLPPYVYPNRGSFGYMKWAAAQLPDYRIAVEFRQAKWMDEEHREETLSFLDRHGMTYVAVDEPQGFKSSIPAIAAATIRRCRGPLPRPQRRDLGEEGDLRCRAFQVRLRATRDGGVDPPYRSPPGAGQGDPPPDEQLLCRLRDPFGSTPGWSVGCSGEGRRGGAADGRPWE